MRQAGAKGYGGVDLRTTEIRNSPEAEPRARPKQSEILITFPVPIPKNFTKQEIRDLLAKQGYYKVEERGDALEVIQDSVLFADKNRTRIVEALEAALKHGMVASTLFPLLHHSSTPTPLFASPPISTAPTATFITATRCRACSRSIRPSARAKHAGALGAPSALIMISLFPTTRKRWPAARSNRGRPRATANARTI